VINLESRVDRWSSVENQASFLNIPILRVDAIDMNSLTPDDCYVAAGVAATWKSHQKAMRTFLESEDQYALILEDDFLVSKSWNLDLLDLALSTNPDFFQLGFLKTGPVDQINLKLSNFQDVSLKFLLRLAGFSPRIGKKFGHRLLVSEQRGLAWKIVPNNIRAGGQAYVVSRQFAQAAQHMNTPAFTSADGMFMTLGDVRSFKMFRFRKSIIDQTDSVTSVQQRYL
jgi:GR25 family glycosyltransferase involved in LPS biosynthesis